MTVSDTTEPSKQEVDMPVSDTTGPSKQEADMTVSDTTEPSKQEADMTVSDTTEPSKQEADITVSDTAEPSKQEAGMTVSNTAVTHLQTYETINGTGENTDIGFEDTSNNAHDSSSDKPLTTTRSTNLNNNLNLIETEERLIETPNDLHSPSISNASNDELSDLNNNNDNLINSTHTFGDTNSIHDKNVFVGESTKTEEYKNDFPVRTSRNTYNRINFDADIDDFLNEADKQETSLEDELTQFKQNIEPMSRLFDNRNLNEKRKTKESILNIDAFTYETDFLTRQIRDGKEEKNYLQQQLRIKDVELSNAENKVKELQLRLIRLTKDDAAKNYHIAMLENDLKEINRKVGEIFESRRSITTQELQKEIGQEDSKFKTEKNGNNKQSKFCVII